MSDNPSFVLKAIEKVEYEQRPIPEISDNEVLIEVKKTGICGSDVHYLVHGRIGDFVVENPMVLGHESAGVISKVGKKVKNVKPGDRVAMEPGATCRVCEECKRGRYELCADMVFAATPPYDGTLARYYTLPSDLVYLLPDNLTLEDGAMMEPLSVGVHSVANIADVRANQTVAVFGCGPVGLVCMAVAKALGASRVIAVDIVPGRLEFAKSYAATDTFQPPAMQPGQSKVQYSQGSAAAMKKQLGLPKGVDVVVDASGAEVSIQTGVFLAKNGGTYVQVGMGAPEVVLPITLMLTKELIFKGSFRYGPGDYQLAIDLVSQGKIDLKPLITHRFAFTDAVKAFQVTRQGKSDDGKGVIKAIISGPDVDVGPL
ncbi:xylitol dehydrogenase [Neolentinus lepideus HHB14362 ss-1]|uniref:Xylitol dehydrogenase n=1 Tax=Neolentinus lepideus HHB14362 ss-1 TaxID=1314782 RepID=A0A165P1R9_9AGAM|nr:xylitol dehydrogenase [Neolentinus lepideus HHB14362 ss-1]